MSTKLYQILSACLVFSALVGLFAVRAQSEPLPLHNGALSPDDPAAKLDPKLQNVPEKVAPLYSHIDTTNSGTTEVSYNTNTGIVQIGPTKPPQTIVPFIYSNVIKPNLGSAPNSVAKPEQNSSSNFTSEIVIGSDDRILINDTTVYPWRAMTKLFITYPGKLPEGCSGVLISAKYVLTAAHCVYDSKEGGFAKVEVIPGLNGTYKPYGSFYPTNIRCYTNWTVNSDPNYDIALITLDQSIGNTVGWLSLAYYPSVDGVTAYIAGYPGDKDKAAVTPYYGYGPILNSTAQSLYYTIDTYNGQSGSGIYRIINDQRYVFGVHTDTGRSTDTMNNGTRIDSAKYNDILAWISSGN